MILLYLRLYLKYVPRVGKVRRGVKQARVQDGWEGEAGCWLAGVAGSTMAAEKKHMQHSTRVLVMAAMMGLATAAWAQDEPAGEAAGLPVGGAAGVPAAEEGDEKGPEVKYNVSAGVAHQFDTDLDEGGEFSLTRFGLGAGVRYPISGTPWSFDHGLLYERDEYDSDTLPWDSVDALSYSLRVGYKIDDNWSVFGGPIVGISAADGADWGDSFRYGAIAGATYRFSPDLTLGLGVAAFDDIGDEFTVFPTLLIDAKLSEGLRIRNPQPQPGFRGTGGIELVCTAVEDWEFGVGGAYDSRRFRLDEMGGRDDLVAENESIPVFARVGYYPAEEWTISAMVGVLLGGEVTIEDDDGDDLADSDYDPALFVGLGVSWRK